MKTDKPDICDTIEECLKAALVQLEAMRPALEAGKPGDQTIALLMIGYLEFMKSKLLEELER